MIVVLREVLDAAKLVFVDDVLDGAEFIDGTKTAGRAAEGIKRNLELDRKRTPRAEGVEAMVIQALSGRRDFSDHFLPQRFSRPIISRYQEGMEYGRHVDNPILSISGTMRTDVSITIFLDDPDSYDGGELVLEVEGEERKVKLARGDAVAYTTGTVHRVAPVTRGHRTAAVVWAQSVVADPHRRDILAELHRVHHRMVEKAPADEETEMLLNAYYKLVRLWAQV